MSYIIEINENGTITLIYPDDTTEESNNLNDILESLKTHFYKKEIKEPVSEKLGRLFEL